MKTSYEQILLKEPRAMQLYIIIRNNLLLHKSVSIIYQVLSGFSASFFILHLTMFSHD